MKSVKAVKALVLGKMRNNNNPGLPPGTFRSFAQDQSQIRRRSLEGFLQLFKVTSCVLYQTVLKYYYCC